MHTIDSIAGLHAYRDKLNGQLAFIATMGALHAGHISLVELAKADNDHVMVSIFVNPTQFDQSSDLEKYPSTLDADLQQLQQAGVDAVFLPDFDMIYPDEYNFQLTEKSLSHKFCGAHRAGHFDGVLTVVMKLFNLVKPQQAYFGEKDYQQLTLIKNMVEAFFLEVNIVSAPIVRETDGLAMSSRNVRLTAIARKIAPQLYATLKNHSTLAAKRQHLTDIGFDVEYLEIMDNRLLAAASLGDVRLIDNVPYNRSGASS